MSQYLNVIRWTLTVGVCLVLFTGAIAVAIRLANDIYPQFTKPSCGGYK